MQPLRSLDGKKPALQSQELPWALQVALAGQGPQLPPHPSEPQVRLPQLGAQLETQLPAWHDCPALQLPHDPPQPSSPHALFPHDAEQ
jgi:hypothetical protein